MKLIINTAGTVLLVASAMAVTAAATSKAVQYKDRQTNDGTAMFIDALKTQCQNTGWFRINGQRYMCIPFPEREAKK